MKKVVITDAAKLTGYIHGSGQKERRVTSDPQQQKDYELGYRKGAKDSCK